MLTTSLARIRLRIQQCRCHRRWTGSPAGTQQNLASWSTNIQPSDASPRTDVAAKGLDIASDMQTLTDAKAFFVYYAGTFIPVIEATRKSMPTLRFSRSMRQSECLHQAQKHLQLIGGEIGPTGSVGHDFQLVSSRCTRTVEITPIVG